MLVYISQGQHLEDNDVVCINHSYGSIHYLVTYDMRMCTFILYSLSGHSISIQHVALLDDAEVDWTYLGYIGDEVVYSQLNIEWGVKNYLDEVTKKFSII